MFCSMLVNKKTGEIIQCFVDNGGNALEDSWDEAYAEAIEKNPDLMVIKPTNEELEDALLSNPRINKSKKELKSILQKPDQEDINSDTLYKEFKIVNKNQKFQLEAVPNPKA